MTDAAAVAVPSKLPVVTFDLFSALLDSRAGGSAAFARIAAARGWRVSGAALYDSWDARNKAAQRDCRTWVPYAELAELALAGAYDDLGVQAGAGTVAADVRAFLDSLPDWPLWPDVADGLPALAGRYRVGLLSNVDDALFARTRAAPLVEPQLALTSQRLGVYKPSPAIYTAARRAVGGRVVHVATSARDVRGTMEAGLPVVRLRRPGHRLDPDGPRPAYEAAGLGELTPLLDRALAS